MSTSVRLPLDTLLVHSSWVRELARELVRDAASADDLVQRAWLAALERPPERADSVRSWLASVLRNLARADRRSLERRAARESAGARAEALPSAHELVERAALQRRVAGAVLELDEPYRSTVLLRFFEELPPREIARRQGVPVATVRTRLARAIAVLRERFDREHDGRTWLSALIPLVPLAPPAPAPLVFTLLMNAKLKLALIALTVCGAFAVWFAARDDAPSAPARAAGVDAAHAAVPASAPPPAPSALGPTEEARAPVSVATAPEASRAKSAPLAGRALHGRVLDAHGAPVRGLRVVLGDGPTAQSGSDGAFEFRGELAPGKLRVDDLAWETVLAGEWLARETEHEIALVVAPRIELAGRIVDEAGLPVAGAELRIDLPEGFRARFARVLDHSASEEWMARSGDDGSFAFASAPVVEGAMLRVHRDSFIDHDEPAPSASSQSLWIVLAQPKAAPGVVSGVVLDPTDRPVEGARVSCGIDTLTTEADGTFHFQLDDERSFARRFGVPATWMSAVKRGFLPASFEPPLAGGKPVWPAKVVLKLAGEPLSIAGRVVDAEGQPLAGIRVFVADATLFGAGERGVLQVESILAGRDQDAWAYVESDEDGRFEIGGLLDRDYAIEARSDETLLQGQVGPVAAGSHGVELRMPTDQLFSRVAGRLLSHAGKPVAGAHVAPMCDAFRSRLKQQVISTQHMRTDSTTTDDDGRFELLNVPKSLVYLRIDGEDILPLEYGRYVEGDERFVNSDVKALPLDRIEALEIVVDRRCHAQLELADAASADEVAFLDEKGRPLEISIYDGNSRFDGPRAPITAGRTPSLAVSDAARTVVLFKANAEVARSAVTLVPGELQQLRQ